MALVPEIRADKNGKMVTRNVRQDPPTSSTKRHMPSPQIFGEHAQEFSQKLGAAISDIGLRGYGVSLAEIMKLARRIPDETARALLETKERSIPSGAFDHILKSALRGGADAERLENIALCYGDDQYIDFFDNEGSSETYRVIMEDINGLTHYPQLAGTTNFYRADNDTQKKAIALVSVMKEADKHDGIEIITAQDGTRSAVLKDERLAQLAVDNAGSLRRFLDLVHERGCNVDVLIEGLNTTAPLRHGVL
jgi:hypothetical protein